MWYLSKFQQDFFLDIDNHPKIYVDTQGSWNSKNNFEKE